MTKAGSEIPLLDLQTFLSLHPMSYAKLAEKLGCSKDSVKSWACHRRNPSREIRQKLASLHVELEQTSNY